MPATHPDELAFLAAIAAAPDDALPRLVFADWLEDRNDPRAAWVRDADLWEWMKPDAHDPLPGLLEALPAIPDYGPGRDNFDSDRFRKARPLIEKLGPPCLPTLRQWYLAHPGAVPAHVVQLFVAAHPPEQLPSVETLQRRLESDSWVEVWFAVVDLGFHGSAAAPAVDALTKIDGWKLYADARDMIERYELPIENAVCRTLAKIGPAALKAVPWLAEHMWMYEESAAEALIQLRANPEEIVEHMNTEDSDEVEAGIRSILELADDPVGFLVRNAQQHTGRVAFASLRLLMEMGPKAAAASPALQELRDSRSEWDSDYVRWAAGEAIRAISPPS